MDLRSFRENWANFKLKNERAAPGEAYQPTDVEHIANVITHGAWILPSLGAMVFMVYLATTNLHLTVAIIYGFALIALFSVSTAFHIVCYTGRFREWKNFFHIGDRAVIYIFIASSYTPWLLLKEFHSWAEEVLFVVWILAVGGILYQYIFHEQYKWMELVLYLVIGICPAVVVVDMKESSGIYELSLGGLTYILGVLFFKSDGIIPFAHAIWHLFVFLGALFHYYAVCVYLMGASALEAPVWDQLS